MDHLPALPSAYDNASGGSGLPYLPSAASAAYLPPSSYDQFGGHAGVRSPPGAGAGYAAQAQYYAAASAAAAPTKKKSSTPRRRAGADGEEPKPRKRKSVAGELNPDGTPATAPRARKPAAPKLDENGNPIPKKRRRKSGADGDDPATAGGSGGKKKGAAAASRKLQDAIGYGDAAAASAGGSAASGAWDASALAGVTRGSTSVGRAPSAFHKDVMDLLYACGDESRHNAPAAFVLEDVLLELLATLTESMLGMQPINSTKDALQVASQMANSRDGSGVSATTISTAHGLRMDTMLYSLRHYPQHYARVKEMWKIAMQQQEADNQAKKAARQTQASNK